MLMEGFWVEASLAIRALSQSLFKCCKGPALQLPHALWLCRVITCLFKRQILKRSCDRTYEKPKIDHMLAASRHCQLIINNEHSPHCLIEFRNIALRCPEFQSIFRFENTTVFFRGYRKRSLRGDCCEIDTD